MTEAIFRERLQAIIDWADLAMKNREEFDSHGVRNLDGPVFDAAREALAENPPPAENLRAIVEAFLHAHDTGTGLIDRIDNRGGRYSSQFLATTIAKGRAAIAASPPTSQGISARSTQSDRNTLVTDEMVSRFADVYYGGGVPHLMSDIRYGLSFAINGELPRSRPLGETETSFRLEWIAAARPPVHPKPMTGKAWFGTFERAVKHMKSQAADAQFVSITEHVTTVVKIDRSDDFRAALKSEGSTVDAKGRKE